MENVLEKIVARLDTLEPDTVITAKLLKAIVVDAIENKEEETVDMSKVFSLEEDF